MKIFLPFKLKDIGGTSTFAKKFQDGMRRRGHDVFFEYRPDYDVLLVLVQAPLRYLIDAKRKGKPIVQRLDGTYYWSVNKAKFPLMNFKAQFCRHFFTDFTVYQSEYSKYCANKFLWKKKLDRSVIIYNGVDLSLFSPDGDSYNFRDNPDQKIFFTASAFRREDQIIPILESLKIYKNLYNKNFKLLVAGSFTGKVDWVPMAYSNFSNVVFLGKISNHDLPKYERSSDTFLFIHPNSSCPNNVIEAMACGLPICGVADGAMKEIVTPSKNGELILAHGDAFWKSRPFDLNAFANNLNAIASDLNRYSSEARDEANQRFSLELMIDNYMDVFSEITK